jgi:hypothetical protein
MSAVLFTAPYFQAFDDDGNPLSGGLVYTYAAGTTTPKATYTDDSGLIPMPNPIVLDAAGRATWWLIGSYKYVVKDALGNTIDTTDNVTAFTTLADANDAYFQTFSGDGTQTVFTTSQDLGTEEKGLDIEIFTGVLPLVTNGEFATDTDWTKGAGWTIAAGVATATGGISTAISQDAAEPLVERKAYSVTYTITRSAGGLIPSVGGVNGVERVLSGTYNEIIIAGSTQVLAFTGNGFTGTLDNVEINLVTSEGWSPISPTAYTIDGTSLTFAVAPPVGTNNIQVRAPALLLGAASAAASSAEASATAALTSASEAATSALEAMESADSAAAYDVQNRWLYDDDTTMADPSTGNLRFNNATPSSATAIAISDLSANTSNPDVSGWIDTWDDGSGSNRGTLYIYKDESNFLFFSINSASVDNTGWFQLSVTNIASAGSIADEDVLFLGFAASGETTVTGGITALTGDVTASGSGSVAATLASGAVEGANLATAVQNAILNDCIAGVIELPEDGDTRLWINIPYGFTISSTTTRSASGTCTATFKINTTALGGTANAVSSTEQEQAHASDNVVVAGDDLVVTISSNSACEKLSFTVEFARAF